MMMVWTTQQNYGMNNATTMMMVWTTWEQWWWFWIAFLRVSWSWMIQRGIATKRSLRKRLWRVSLGESCHGLHTTSFLMVQYSYHIQLTAGVCSSQWSLWHHHKSSQFDGYSLNYVCKKIVICFRGCSPCSLLFKTQMLGLIWCLLASVQQDPCPVDRLLIS